MTLDSRDMHRDRFAQCTVRNWGQHAVAIIAAFFMFLKEQFFRM